MRTRVFVYSLKAAVRRSFFIFLSESGEFPGYTAVFSAAFSPGNSAWINRPLPLPAETDSRSFTVNAVI